MNFGDKTINNNVLDIFLICFPIWIPLFLILFFYFFPSFVAVTFLLTLFFLGETHFAATWLFFLDSNNRSWLKERPHISFIFPILIIVILFLVFFFISPSAAILLSSIASAFHVTRQSIGINKIFSIRDHKGLKFAQYAIYAMSAFFLFIGFLRFFANYSFTEQNLRFIQYASIAFIMLISSFIYFKKTNKDLSIKFHLTVLTGMLLYSPYTFVPRPEYAVAMGVGMHYMQYLSLTIPIYLRKSKELIKTNSANLVFKITNNKVKLIFYLLIYASLMLLFRQFGKGFNTFEYSKFIIIPICLQSLHFYYDSFIWKFSDPHIRKEIGSYIFAKKENLQNNIVTPLQSN